MNIQMKTFLSTFFVWISLMAGAQDFTIAGKVLDSASRQPLEKASVYCQNTTQGTSSAGDGAFRLTLKDGGYNLIITFTGYQTQQVRISPSTGSNLEILMIKEEKNMDEVVVRSSNEVKDGWEKYGSFFKEQFIGATKLAERCSLQNAPALKFYYYKRSDKLKVLATEPVQIANYALGYNLKFQLDSFMYYYKTNTSSYRGYCFYEEMQGTEEEKKIWAANRKEAYQGSRLHFLRSYYDSTLKGEGWVLDLLDESEESKAKYVKVKDPYDTLHYAFVDSTKEVELDYPAKLQVTYMKKGMEEPYRKKNKLPNIAIQTSFLDFRNGIVIQQNGYFYDQKDLVNQGYWSWKNLADQVPYDYEPDN
jgi:CarboxypepD_reg-like domain